MVSEREGDVVDELIQTDRHEEPMALTRHNPYPIVHRPILTICDFVGKFDEPQLARDPRRDSIRKEMECEGVPDKSITPRREAHRVHETMKVEGFPSFALVQSHPVTLEKEVPNEVGHQQREWEGHKTPVMIRTTNTAMSPTIRT